MVWFIDDENAVLFLYFSLQQQGYDWPPEAGETNTSNYEKKIRKLLIGQGWDERNADVFINNTRVAYKKAMPSEDEQKWFSDDPRASLWFLVKIDNNYLATTSQSFTLEMNTMLNSFEPSGKSLPPTHTSRVTFIKDKIKKAIFNVSTRDNIINAHREWNQLILEQDIFYDVNSNTGVTPDWLLSYLRENNIFLKDYMCGDSIDEKLAFCYASYFTWHTWYETNKAEKELFVKKFKSALSTQKSREKKKKEKRKLLNVSISEEAYDKMRYIAELEGISNARTVEYAFNLAWQHKTRRNLK
ncbi:hypothetical protein HV096_10275 [Citrobacter freundii]|nr:hypothetical protein [Citrobacter freundii]MBA8032478.1 hypothetical protein [Citrobacter freundii]